MSALALVLAGLAGLAHVGIFALEAVLFDRPSIHRRFGTRESELDGVRPWALNQGWYNLFLAAGAILGVVLVAQGGQGAVTAGRTLVLFACSSMVAAALVLVGSNRSMWRSAAFQGTIPLAAIALTIAS